MDAFWSRASSPILGCGWLENGFRAKNWVLQCGETTQRGCGGVTLLDALFENEEVQLFFELLGSTVSCAKTCEYRIAINVQGAGGAGRSVVRGSRREPPRPR